ncbi:hypothetical protein ACFV4K_25170 [Nocardia sp. NPDC059764]|uniref:hypothetical protein n=1 Tax=Nocardia sp. NPDC059764 TaxID=3346939 RepID=UPI00364896AB
MQHARRPRPHLRIIGLILAPLAGAAVLAAGQASAEPSTHGGNSPGISDPSRSSGDRGNRPGVVNYGNDDDGIHARDPLGFNHTDVNPVLQNQHPRRPGTVRPPSEPPNQVGGGNPATWTPTWKQDGSGYTVCPPLAGHC